LSLQTYGRKTGQSTWTIPAVSPDSGGDYIEVTILRMITNGKHMERYFHLDSRKERSHPLCLLLPYNYHAFPTQELYLRPADMVEVFHNLSWKMVIVSKAFGWDYFLIRLVVSFSEFEASKPAPLRRLKCLLLHKDSVTS
nr:hypothetical protein [Tanacetum cinerariifolium]